ncbi:uncharacterized protein LOC131164601 [Malania oleifera]|uniref:uncharacterized protein LOC131164601 n=1 Tax=Malania oleifera TaxID=397392 RepID=UPI0025AE3C1A|nr:uncharacterized protein LOC131164601 [Malania oleifera]
MEGAGSRLGRASSRYGTATTVFSGPVRRWKKKWVHVSPSSAATVTCHSSQSNSADSCRLLLCRWTPISSSSPAEDERSSAEPEEPPRRKFRYTPIALIEEQKKAIRKQADDETKTSEPAQSTPTLTSMSDDLYEKSNSSELQMEAAQVSDKNQLSLQDSYSCENYLDLGLCLKRQDDSHNLDGQDESTPV